MAWRLAMRDAHAVVVLTEWGEFREYDYATAFSAMPKPAWILDGRMVLDHAALKAIGFNVEVIGKRVEAPRSAADGPRCSSSSASGALRKAVREPERKCRLSTLPLSPDVDADVAPLGSGVDGGAVRARSCGEPFLRI